MDLQKQPQRSPEAPRTPAAAAAQPTAEADLRASDADRDRVADLLRDALAEGRLTAEEHSERIDGVYAARTLGELEPLVRDLPGARTSAAPAPAPGPGTVPAEPDENLVAVFSSAVRKGRWRPGRRTHAYAVFGNVEIDLSEALFEYPHIVIKAFSVLGSVEVTVPENVTLRGSGGGVLGSFEVDHLESPDAGAPVVQISGVAVLGSVEAKPKRGSVLRDLHHKLRKHLGS
ncbi:DUF1707 domain-containing protein [Streptomyces sp. NPDC058373]|uniref:DUF1707 SHOCT-like domain-containing protein n=1 Tax=Streptomyces sp. NPDC058373 TaxID=3346465 RepID=UPI0036667917